MCWTGIFAVLNCHPSRQNNDGPEDKWRGLSWAGTERDEVIRDIRIYSDTQCLSPIAAVSFPILLEWMQFLDKLNVKWRQAIRLLQQQDTPLDVLETIAYLQAYDGVNRLLVLAAEVLQGRQRPIVRATKFSDLIDFL